MLLEYFEGQSLSNVTNLKKLKKIIDVLWEITQNNKQQGNRGDMRKSP